MLKIYRERKQLQTIDCDMSGVWRLSGILAAMQEASGMHSEILGIGRDNLLRKNLVWVLSRGEVTIDRYPKAGEMITIETFPMNHRRWLFPRCFRLYDQKDRMIGKIGTIWVLMDFTERKMAGPEAVLPFMPDNSDLSAPLPMPGVIDDVDALPQRHKRLPTYSDLDVNRHVNNTRYADWLCDALGVQTMKEKQISNLLIHYTREILPDQEINLTLFQKDNQIHLLGEHGLDKHFEMGATLTTRS